MKLLLTTLLTISIGSTSTWNSIHSEEVTSTKMEVVSSTIERTERGEKEARRGTHRTGRSSRDVRTFVDHDPLLFSLARSKQRRCTKILWRRSAARVEARLLEVVMPRTKRTRSGDAPSRRSTKRKRREGDNLVDRKTRLGFFLHSSRCNASPPSSAPGLRTPPWDRLQCSRPQDLCPAGRPGP